MTCMNGVGSGKGPNAKLGVAMAGFQGTEPITATYALFPVLARARLASERARSDE